MNKKVLVASLGGSPEPIKISLNYHHPDKAVFFASELSAGQVQEIINDVGFTGEVEVVSVLNPNDLILCLDTANRMLAGIDTATNEVVVDFTGGTKVMVAALAMAAKDKCTRFSYVSGSIRDKGGLGVVRGGEQVLEFDLNYS